MKIQFKNQIYVYADSIEGFVRVHTCDTQDQAAEWIVTHGDTDAYEYTIDGTPEAWHEQFGYWGGSSICNCGDDE